MYSRIISRTAEPLYDSLVVLGDWQRLFQS